MKTTVIIPFYSSHKTIKKCLAPLLKVLDYIDIILVDDASPRPFDSKLYPDIKVITHPKNKGPSSARNSGIKHSNSDVLIFIDADVVICELELIKVINRFQKDKSIAFTVQHSKETPSHDFFTRYKAFYMNYSFSISGQNQKVQFLYSSYCGFKNNNNLYWPEHIRFGEDAYLATQIINQNKKISFYFDIELKHLKKYHFLTLLKNDFAIPFHFAASFKKRKTKGLHAHTNYRQLCAIALSPFIYITWPIWIICNSSFFTSLKELGLIKVIAFTLLDQFVMGCGILCGLVTYSLQGLRKSLSPNY